MQRIQPFKLERYFAQYEFKAPYLLSASDCESLSMQEVLSMADAETRELWEKLSLGYTESPGHPRLRAEISNLYQAAGPEQTLVLAPEEGIFIAMHSLLQPGDEVIAVYPAYQSLLEVARSIGCTVKPWRLRPGPDGWSLNLNELEDQINDQTRLIVVNFPHNPTGHLLSAGEQKDVIGIARKHGLYLFSDEMYRLLEYDAAKRLPPACDLYERAVSLSGMSKTFSMPGLRIGWLATQDEELVHRWIALKDYTTICSSAPSEILALIGLRARDRIVERNLEIIRGNLGAAEQFFDRHADLFRWLPPKAGSVAFPEWKGSTSVDEFCQRLVDRMGVMVVPGSMFDAPGQHFRLGLGRRNFVPALERVEEFLSESPQRSQSAQSFL